MKILSLHWKCLPKNKEIHKNEEINKNKEYHKNKEIHKNKENHKNKEIHKNKEKHKNKEILEFLRKIAMTWILRMSFAPLLDPEAPKLILDEWKYELAKFEQCMITPNRQKSPV